MAFSYLIGGSHWVLGQGTDLLFLFAAILSFSSNVEIVRPGLLYFLPVLVCRDMHSMKFLKELVRTPVMEIMWQTARRNGGLEGAHKHSADGQLKLLLLRETAGRWGTGTIETKNDQPDKTSSACWHVLTQSQVDCFLFLSLLSPVCLLFRAGVEFLFARQHCVDELLLLVLRFLCVFCLLFFYLRYAKPTRPTPRMLGFETLINLCSAARL